jgi:hypothetical protein
MVDLNSFSARIGFLSKGVLAILLSMGIGLPAIGEELEFNPRTVIKRAFPAIVSPETHSREQAEEKGTVRDEELVLGVVMNGEARAYPINTLTGPRREIINDKLGSRSIAATW